MEQSPYNQETKCPYTRFMNFLWKLKNSDPKRNCFKIMLIAPLACLVLMVFVIGADMIYSSGLYGGSNLWESLGGFMGSLINYTPQAVESEGKLGYLILGVMITLILWFPRWVIAQYTK